MKEANITRIKILYTLFWLAWPLWGGALIQGALWVGMVLTGSHLSDGLIPVFVLSISILVVNVMLGLMLPADDIRGGVSFNGLISLLRELELNKASEVRAIEAKKRAELEEAIKLARGMDQ